MPQLNLETFVTQYFWLIVLLTFFYILCATIVIPKVATIFKTRQRLENLASDAQPGQASDLPEEVKKAEKLTLRVLSQHNSIKTQSSSSALEYRDVFLASQRKWVDSL